MEYNSMLERLEVKLFERLEALIDAERYEDAAKVISLMDSCGII